MVNFSFPSLGQFVSASFLSVSVFVLPANAQSIDQGRFGRGLKVGKTYASADYNPVYDVTPITVELWARVNGKADASTLISCEPRNAISHWELFSEKETGRFGVGMPGFTPSATVSTADIADDQWHFLAFVFDGTKVQLFVDGKQVAESTVKKTGKYPDVGPLNFGYQLGVAPHPDTTIDEVRISKTARKIAGSPDKPFENDADTMGLWHFDEDDKAYQKSGGFADVSNNRNPAKLKDAKTDGQFTNGGFDNTVGGKTRWQDMDFGPFFSSTITPPLDKQNVTYKAISIRLGKEKKHAVTFDTELLRMSAAWEGDFIKLSPGREGLGRYPEMGAKPIFQTSVGRGWAIGPIEQGGGLFGNQEKLPEIVASFSDPRKGRLGPLPLESGRFRGIYVWDEQVVLSYDVFEVRILEAPSVETLDGETAFIRTLRVAPNERALRIWLGRVSGAIDRDKDQKSPIRLWKDGEVTILETLRPGAPGDGEHLKMIATDAGDVVAVLPPCRETAVYRFVACRAPEARLDKLAKLLLKVEKNATPDFEKLTKGGPAQYPPITTKGTLGKPDGPYAVDTLTAPDDNPWHSFLRFGGVDFFKNGDAAVCSVSGDVWVVSGIDDKLQSLKWKRFATGLFQPLGLRIVDDKIYVLGRDQITKLHDLNNDGEADFYENFNNDGLVTTAGHAYVTSLERDPAGNLYYIKCADGTPHGGSILRVSPDGKKLDVFATGVRNGNGMGMTPWGQPSFADNEGDWVPASRIDLVNKSQFLGYTPMAHSDTAPSGPGRPIVWMPQNMDNSSGSQVWVQGDKWGLPAGTMLHTSYGQAALLQVMPEKVKLPTGEDVTQAGVWRFPLTFATGIMRGQFRPQDGQLYVCGLRGWQTNGVKDGALQRVRYTGKPMHQPTELHAHQNGIELKFSCELDKETASDVGSWSILQWNYRWSSDYGSKHYSVADPNKQGYDTLEVKKATLLPDGRGVFLEVPNLQPVMQMRISCNIDAKDGETIKTDVYNTIHALGERYEVKR